MKKSIKKFTVILCVLALVTAMFAVGAYAKYTVGTSGADSARIAKFGVELKAGKELFANKYAKDDTQFKYTGEYSVASSNADKLIAPGTSGTVELFSISGAPEVAVNVTASLNESNALNMVTLPAGTYTDYRYSDENGNYSKTFNNDTDYYPIQWTLKHDGTTVVTGNLQKINDYITGEKFSSNYEPNTGLDAINGIWTLEWTWDYGTGAYDAQDTYLGHVAAGGKDDKVNLSEAFELFISVTQID